MNPNEIKKAFDLLDKLDFFYGQRAGRELWNDKPVDVQNQDIEDFARDIKYLRAYINQLEAEVERLNTENRILFQKRFNIFERLEFTDKIRAEAYKECIEKVKDTALEIKENAFQGCYVISKANLDNLVKESMVIQNDTTGSDNNS